MSPSPEAFAAAAEVYGAILADPDRRAALLAARERRAAERAAAAAAQVDGEREEDATD